jgi:hypothetical protein
MARFFIGLFYGSWECESVPAENIPLSRSDTGDRADNLANFKENVIRGFADQNRVTCLPVHTAHVFAKNSSMYWKS